MNGLPTRVQCESRVLNILDAVRKGEKVESDTVELKSEWPEPERAARQICGLCNASRGTPALLIIGADDKASTVAGAPPVELADWLPQLLSYFEGVAPRLVYDMMVPSDGVSVRALLFETDRAPYVVKVPGSDRLEVAFRSGTRTRSARREDLIRLLVPVVATPHLEIVGGYLVDELDTARPGLAVNLRVYCTPRTSEAIGLAAHRTSLEIWTGVEHITPINFSRGGKLDAWSRDVAYSSDHHQPDAIVTSPSGLDLSAQLWGHYLHCRGIQYLGIRLRATPAGSDIAASADALFQDTGKGRWIFVSGG